MFGLFSSEPFADPQLGLLERSRSMWRGTISLGDVAVPLVLSGSRSAPDSSALVVARSVTAELPLWRPAIERELFQHYSPYAEAVAAGEEGAPESGLPAISVTADVWRYATVAYVRVCPLDGELAVEIGYRVAWDDEHTLGARLRDGEMIELCGSVLAP